MTINAPRDGVVLEKKVLVGQLVSPQNSPLFIMMPQGNDWEIYALVSESDVAKVQKDQTVEFTAEAYAGKNVRYRGKVLKKDLTPTQLSTGAAAIGLGLSGPTNFGVTISVIHEPGLDKDFPLISGMTANVDVLVNSVKDKLRVPKAATQYQPANISPEDKERMDAGAREQWQAIWVWTAAQKTELVLIKTGVDDGSYLEVKEVQSGSNVPQLQPGVEVVIEDPPPEPTGSGFPFFGGGNKPINIPIR
jgi:multidrug efflux pump subunit AcrA (membrane-fusion protein)